MTRGRCRGLCEIDTLQGVRKEDVDGVDVRTNEEGRFERVDENSEVSSLRFT